MKYLLKINFFLIFLFFLLSASVIGIKDGVIPSIKFKDTDIDVVLQTIAEKAIDDGKRVNIVTSPSVTGTVNISLEQVHWLTALKVILNAYNYGYKWVGDNIILVSTIQEIQALETREKERQDVEALRTKVFTLKYIDANDAQKAIIPILSSRGKVSVLRITGQTGWKFGTDFAKRERREESNVSRTKILLVSDTTTKMEEIESLLSEIDVMPKQVLIKARIMEVNRDYLEDIGFDWGTGSTGAESSTLEFIDLNKANNKTIGGQSLGDQITPSGFNPESTGLTTANTGLKLGFRKLSGVEFEVILHALEEDVDTNTLSAPSILTLDNQEASILVGQKFPIVQTQTSTETSRITGGSLDYYQDIGIQLNVVPQISGENENFINMIIHPAVTSRQSDVTITDQQGNTLASYPLLSSREAETQVMIKDGETIVIGGLLKDVQTSQQIGVPLLKDIPLLGKLFSRDTTDIEKIDLLIFITAKVVKPGGAIPSAVIDKSTVENEFQ